MKKCDVCGIRQAQRTIRTTATGFNVCKSCLDLKLPLKHEHSNCRVCLRPISEREDNKYEGQCQECYDLLNQSAYDRSIMETMETAQLIGG